ncbi:uncharacterized protein LOC121308457 [Polyodon spathula]|uniref:uncharacterized protein LOC121308457 n=2 Tax=Polyodon spathula TaxID=7913 RepID=UPI001B7E261A|nr:uncharacterized protein LOC121308457 [Polyodon spathula]
MEKTLSDDCRNLTYGPDRGHIFGMPWLDSCLEETLLPEKPWHRVYNTLGAALAKEVETQLKHPQQSQFIFTLLGEHFVEKHFSDFPNQPSILCPPSMSESERDSLRKNTLAMLEELCEKSAQISHCQRRPDGDLTGLSQEMTNFINDTYSLVVTEMEQLLARQEAKKNDGEGLSSDTWQSAFALMARRRRTKSVESKDLHLTTRRGSAFQIQPEDEGIPLPGLQPPPLSSPGSEVLGRSVSAILTSDPQRMATVCERLKGRPLPTTLRNSVWIDKLLNTDKVFHKAISLQNLEKTAREKFGRAVGHRVAELKLRSATRSPVSGLIENAVVEKYERTPCMQTFATNEQMITETSKALNILYVHNGTYEPYLIHWLFPLQIAFKQADTKAEHCYELAMYLHFLIQKFPSWPEIFTLAERVMRHVEEEDTDFYAHLQLCSSRNAVFDPKDFLAELIARERQQARELLDVADRTDRHQAISKELLANPIIFLRKWMGEGFMSVLDLPAVLLIWDQLFMHDWSRKVMEDFCLAVLMLLKDPLMAADSYQSMRQVFLGHASHLFTADIQKGWIHLQQGGLAADIPAFNRLHLRLLYGPFPKQGTRKDVGQVNLGYILPIGLKDVVVKLILQHPKSDAAHNAWLKQFDPLAVKLTVSVFYGNAKLRSKSSLLKPSVEKRAPGKEADEFKLQYNDTFVFDSLDPSEFREVDPSEDKPVLVMKLLYSAAGFTPVTLGWVKVDIFQEEKTAARTLWAPNEISTYIQMQAGRVPEYITDQIPVPSTTEPVQQGSGIRVTVYDPAKKLHRQRDSPVQEERVVPQEESRFLYPPWVPHSPTAAVPQQASVSQPVDLYIDAVHYIPDNATIIKVTGRIMRSGLEDLPDILALPELKTSARNPEFRYRMTVKADNQKPLDPHMMLLLRVYTIDADSGELCVIGNCIARVFNDHGQLNAGGFQLRLRGGMPSKDPVSLTESSLNHHPVIPCCTVLIRILPHVSEPAPTPSYLSGFYFTDEAKPSKSELEIISTFQRDRNFPTTEEDMVQLLTGKEQANIPPDQWLAWVKERLDARKQLPPQHPPAHLSIHHMVRFYQQAGIRVQIAQAFGLPEGLYVNAFARVLKGAASLHLPELPERWGGEEKFLTRQRDLTSLQKSPCWTDPSTVLHPYIDPHSVLLVQLFSLKAVYTPDPSGQRQGSVTSHSGGQPDLDALSQLGWAALPLFQG